MSHRIQFSPFASLNAFPRLSVKGLVPLLAFGLFLFSSASAEANSVAASGGSGMAPQSTFDWENRDAYIACDMNCTTQKSNEALITESQYIKNLLDNLKNQSQADRVKFLGDFCDTSVDKGEDCYKRYLFVVGLRLNAIHAQIAVNSNQLVELKTNAVAIRTQNSQLMIKGPEKFQDLRDANARKLSHTIETPEIQKMMSKFPVAELSALGAREIANAYLRKPQPSDYPKIKTVPRDPNFPGGEQIMIVEKDSDGKFKIDQARFDRELADFEARSKLHQGLLRDYENRVQASTGMSAADALNHPKVATPASLKAEEVQAITATKGILENTKVKSEPTRTLASVATEVTGLTTVRYTEQDIKNVEQVVETELKRQ